MIYICSGLGKHRQQKRCCTPCEKKPSRPHVSRCRESSARTCRDTLLIHFVNVQPVVSSLQRGSLAISQAMIVGSSLRRTEQIQLALAVCN